MELSGEYIFDAPQEVVWEAVRDPDVLGSILPGGEGITEVGEDAYQGLLNIRVGPVQGKFQGNIRLSNIVAPHSYDIAVDGKGAPGFVNATGNLQLTGQGDQTHMAYAGTARVGGRIASVGQRLLDASAKSIVSQSLDALNAYLQVEMQRRAAEQPAVAVSAEEEDSAEPVQSAPPVPAYKPPTQTRLAANVARDVVNDLVPPLWQTVIISVITTILTVLLLKLIGVI